MDKHVRTQKESKQARGSLARECRQTDSPVRTWKESKQARGTHFLESIDRQSSQERIQASEGHSQTGEHRQTDQSGHRKNLNMQGALTCWRAQTDGQVRTWKESEQVRGTHSLESTDRQASQDMERIQVRE